MGTALNKILKDVIVRSQQMIGKVQFMYLAGIAMVCLLNGKLKNNTEKKERTKTIFPLSNLDKNVENLLKSGFRSKKRI